jgi:ankyrin repeat protein/ABC-type amino acid transport substrate-binding protein
MRVHLGGPFQRFALFTIICALSASASAKELRVAVGGQYLPLHGEKDGVPIGLEVDIANLIAKELGATAKFVNTSRELKMSSLKAVELGKVDFSINSVTPSPKRKETVSFTDPYVVLRYRLVGKKSAKMKDPLNARGRVVGSKLALKAIRSEMPRAKLVFVSSAAKAIKMVRRGKARFYLTEDVSIPKAIENTNLKIVGPAFGESPLAIAVRLGSESPYNRVLRQRAGAIEALRKKWGLPSTPYELIRAVRAGEAQRVGAMLAAGLSADTRNEDNKTLLELAFRRNPDNGVIAQLLAHGAKLTKKDGRKLLRIYLQALEKDDKATVRRLIELLPDVNAKFSEGIFHKARDMTFLHPAAARGRLDAVTLLLKRGAEVNTEDNLGNTPLSDALDHKHIETAALLLKNGADANAIDSDHKSMLSLSICLGSRDHQSATFDLLLQHGANPKQGQEGKEDGLLYKAIRCNHKAITKRLLDLGADANRRSLYDERPLHEAKDAEVVKLLLEHGADLDVANRYGDTPLYRAADRGRMDVFYSLLEAGADLRITFPKLAPPIRGGRVLVVQSKSQEQHTLFEASRCEIAKLSEEAQKPIWELSRNWTNNAQGVAFRAQPSASAPVLEQIPDRSELEVIRKRGPIIELEGRSGRWTQVRWGSKEGWVFDSWLARIEELPQAPIDLPPDFPLSWDILRGSEDKWGIWHDCADRRSGVIAPFLVLIISPKGNESGDPPTLTISNVQDSMDYRIILVKKGADGRLTFWVIQPGGHGKIAQILLVTPLRPNVAQWEGSLVEIGWEKAKSYPFGDTRDRAKFESKCENMGSSH